MNTFKRKALFTAVLATVGAAGTAEAVYLNPNGTGQVLVYPYYTVQSDAGGNAWNTYISVVNTTTQAKAVKVRFLEGKTSAEVLDFNLFLSPNDVWTGAVVPSATGSTAPAELITTDVSCTSPGPIGVGANAAVFRNYQYAAGVGGSALPGTGLDRTREGYVEMIEMSTLSGTTATNVTHVSGVPANCAAVRGPSFTPGADAHPPSGGLMGTGTLINVNNGLDSGYKADALEAFSITSQYSVPSTLFPALDTPNPDVSLVVNAGTITASSGGSSSGLTAYWTDFTGATLPGAFTTASVFMHSAVMNEYILDAATGSATDWVITQPLKNRFVTNLAATEPYTATMTANGACEPVSFQYFNREEQSAAASGTDFSPPIPGSPGNAICWESNVLSIRNNGSSSNLSGVLASVNTTAINVRSDFQNGWALLGFTGTNAVAPGLGLDGGVSTQVLLDSNAAGPAVGAPAAETFYGLPVTGFMMRTFNNGTLTCAGAGGTSGTCQGTYSAIFKHSYRNTITP